MASSCIIDGKFVPKIEQVRARMAAGDWPGALKLAARFPQLGEALRQQLDA